MGAVAVAGLACGVGQEVAPASVVRQAQEAKELAVRVDSAADWAAEADMVVVVATAIMVDGAAAQAVKVVAPAAGAAEEG